MIAPVAAFGQSIARQLSRLGALARFFAGALGAGGSYSPAGRRVGFRVFLNQVWFTALQAVPLVVVLSAILSFLVISQAVRELGRLDATEFIGTLLVVAIVRELGPLLTALVVVGRSGTAIAAEMATNTVMGEVRALEGMGIDPYHYLVLPRLGAAIISTIGLIVVFDVVALGSGLLAAAANDMSPARYADVVLASLSQRDVWLSLGKGLVFGTIVGIVPAFHGLAVRRAATEVPIAASRAVVFSILAVFISSAIFVVVA